MMIRLRYHLPAEHPLVVEHDREEQAEPERQADGEQREQDRPHQDAEEDVAGVVVVDESLVVLQPDARPPAGDERLAVVGDELPVDDRVGRAGRRVEDRVGLGVVDAGLRLRDGCAEAVVGDLARRCRHDQCVHLGDAVVGLPGVQGHEAVDGLAAAVLDDL